MFFSARMITGVQENIDKVEEEIHNLSIQIKEMDLEEF